MSARFGTDNDQAVGLDADHLDLCKFGNAKTPNASRVLQTFVAISKLMDARAETAGTIPDTPSVPEQSCNNLKGTSSLEERLDALRR
jgi:hypothetical protein